MDRRFKFWMRWFGKKHGDYELIKGDFFHDDHKEIINSASYDHNSACRCIYYNWFQI